MFICVEGCLGVGKAAFVRLCSQFLPCVPVYEETERNPFLDAFYHAPNRKLFAEHLQYTFLFMLDWQFRQAQQLAQSGKTVLCNFHPLKNLVYGHVILPEEKRAEFLRRYHELAIPQPDLLIYLKADEHTILSRIRKRHDPYCDQIDITYVIQILSAYEAFFRTYKGPYLCLETSHLDYTHPSAAMEVYLRQIMHFLHMPPSARPRSSGRQTAPIIVRPEVGS